MAKIRVYELARDLNMKNKALLEKLSEMNVTVRSHMSSLDDETVASVKANLLGKKPGEVEETRVKKTVIRRRKRVTPEPLEETHAEAPTPEVPPEKAAVDTADAAEPDVSTAPEAMDIDTQAVKEPDEIPEAPEEVEEPTEVPEPAAKKGQKLVTARKLGHITKEKAKIIKRAIPEKPPEETPPPKEEEAPEAVKAEKPAPAKEEIVEPEKKEATPPEKEKKPEPEKEEKPEKRVDETKPTEESKAEDKKKTADKERKTKVLKKAEKPESPKVLKPRRKSRKQRKETPAKIIKPAPATFVQPAATEKPAADKKKDYHKRPPADQKTRPAFDDRKPVPESEIQKKRKKRKKDVEEAKGVAKEPRKDIKWSKKKISFKRKEVVEASALYEGGRRGKKSRKGAKGKATMAAQKTQITTPKAIKRRIKIDDTIILSDLAKRMGIKANEMIAKLMTLGVMVTVNQTIDFDTAVLVAAEFGYDIERASFEEEVLLKAEAKDDPESMTERPPVVTIMGHVDHGKTSLLDVIRKTKITEIEAGGITQHIGAYNVKIDKGNIVFLDTPGHEAFTSMRARGATVTDIVVLVVAADDGVMPQTIEAINHANAAKVPIIVAVNKIDKANADPDRVYRELSEQGLVPEDWGGETIFVKVSAKMNQGIDNLLEMILLQAEVLELKANPDKLAVGYVVEAKLDSGRGPVATVLIQEGTLSTGDSVVCGMHYGKIRAMLNDRGVQVESAGPSLPVKVLGLSGVPNSGDEMIALVDDKSAKQVSTHRIQKQRSMELAKTNRLSLEKLFEKMQEGEIKDLNLIIKADVHGSIEALSDSLVKLSNEEVSINVIHSATGTITESDVSLATVSNAIIIGFNVRPSTKVQALAADENVDMRFYNVIYNVIKEIKDAIVGMMASTFEERTLGRCEIREVFHVPKVGAIAGSYVTDGSIKRGAKARVLREGVVMYEGKVSSLRRFKDDVKEVNSGYECGVGIENYNDLKVGDVIECFYLEEIKPEME